MEQLNITYDTSRMDEIRSIVVEVLELEPEELTETNSVRPVARSRM